MRIKKAVITAASPSQRSLPMQRLIDRDGSERSILAILLGEAVQAGAEEICVVICPGDAGTYASIAGEHSGRVRLVEQKEPRGYGHAVYSAREFTAGEPFLHLVGDHLYIGRASDGCAARLVAVAEAESSAVSGVQPTREGQLTHFGAIGGQLVPGSESLYKVETVLEKPTPTEAEQKIIVPGLRAGHYLCFFGIHALTPTVMDILADLLARRTSGSVTLSDALSELARRERYLALEMKDRRYDLGARYGLLTAQMALALEGKDREEVLSQLVELLALREAGSAGSGR